MGMQVLESQYQAKTDEELLRLVVELEQLTPEAQVQLHTELAKRGISEAHREVSGPRRIKREPRRLKALR